MDELGPGHRESVYQSALSIELSQSAIKHTLEHPIVITYSNVPVGYCKADIVLYPTEGAPGWSQEEQDQLYCYILELKLGRLHDRQSWTDQLNKYIRFIPTPPGKVVTGRILAFA